MLVVRWAMEIDLDENFLQCQMLVENTLKLAKRLAQFQFNWVNREIRALKEDISLG